ncbi:MAG: hypothetical protein ACXWJF_09230 [Burkholderiaceae bacterium]
MKIKKISVPRRTPANAGVFRTRAESSNVDRSVRSIQTTIHEAEHDRVDAPT